MWDGREKVGIGFRTFMEKVEGMEGPVSLRSMRSVALEAADTSHMENEHCARAFSMEALEAVPSHKYDTGVVLLF